MQKRVRVDKKRLERFNFERVSALKQKVDGKPELREALRKDFSGTLKAEGVKVDHVFLEKIEKEWRSQISRDIKSKVAATPERYPLLKRVLEGNPIRVHVNVEGKGRNIKTKEVSG